MSKEFNIFNNLDEMMKCNFLHQIRTMDAANNLNQSENADADFEEFDALLNNNVVKSPKKRNRKQGIAEKESGENLKSRRKSSSKERSLSPTMPFLENLVSNLDNIPVSGRTRRSLGRANKALNQTTEFDSAACSAKDTTEKATSSKRGRGGRGRGKGRGRAKNTKSAIATSVGLDCTIDTDDSSHHSCDSDYNPETQNTAPVPNNSNTSASIMERFLGLRSQASGGRSRVMRSRRNYLAEVAARCQTVDTIDLITSPFPRVEGSVTLDSDGEEQPPKSRKENSTLLDTSLDDDNPELSVKIIWKGKPEAFKLRKYQKFSTIFQLLAEREGADIENIVFNLNERLISHDDTPDSIGYKIFHFINGRVLTADMSSPLAAVGKPKKQRNPNQIKLKIQSDKWKRPLQIDMLKSEKFRILYIKCSEELNVGIEKIKLSFDGESLQINDTPADLDLEGGEAIDLRLKN